MLLHNENSSKAASLSAGELGVPLLHGAMIGTINLALSVIGTFGNFLIIFAILKTPQLRKRPSNILLLSLAVADLLVTMAAKPLFASYVIIKTADNRCARGVDMAYFLAATLSGGSSTSHLAAISIDRALATVKPHKYHSIMKKWGKKMLCLCWGSVIIAIIAYLTIHITKAGKSAAQTLSILIALFVATDFLLMIGSYAIVFCKIKNHKFHSAMRAMPSSKRERAMERRVSGAIAIVIFLFVACWFPVVGYRLSQPDKSAHCSFGLIQLWFRTLCLANSSMNFIIYSLRIRQFRTAYLRIINRMLQSFRQIARNCLSTSAEQLNTTVTPITLVSVPLTINMPSLSKESKDASETI